MGVLYRTLNQGQRAFRLGIGVVAFLAPIMSQAPQAQSPQGDVYESGGKAQPGGCQGVDNDMRHYLKNGTIDRCKWAEAHYICDPLTQQYGMPVHVRINQGGKMYRDQYERCGGDPCDPRNVVCWGWKGRDQTHCTKEFGPVRIRSGLFGMPEPYQKVNNVIIKDRNGRVIGRYIDLFSGKVTLYSASGPPVTMSSGSAVDAIIDRCGEGFLGDGEQSAENIGKF